MNAYHKTLMSNMTQAKIGKTFEGMFVSACAITRVSCVRVPNSAIRYKDKKTKKQVLKQGKSPFDFIVAYQGRGCCVDTKTVDDKVFNYSQITKHQLDNLCLMGQNMASGYVVWFREVDKVCYFDWKKLASLFKGNSLKPEQGVQLGGGSDFDPRLFLDEFSYEL